MEIKYNKKTTGKCVCVCVCVFSLMLLIIFDPKNLAWDQMWAWIQTQVRTIWSEPLELTVAKDRSDIFCWCRGKFGTDDVLSLCSCYMYA